MEMTVLFTLIHNRTSSSYSTTSLNYQLPMVSLSSRKKNLLLKPQNTPRPDHGKQSCPSLLTVPHPTQVIQIIPAQQRIHPILNELLDWLQQCFPSVKWLANYAIGLYPFGSNHLSDIREICCQLSTLQVKTGASGGKKIKTEACGLF